MERLNAREIIESGILHVVNEQLLWPKGHTLTLWAQATCIPEGEVGKCGHGPDGMEHVLLDEPGWIIVERGYEQTVTSLDVDEHAARHYAFQRLPGGDLDPSTRVLDRL